MTHRSSFRYNWSWSGSAIAIALFAVLSCVVAASCSSSNMERGGLQSIDGTVYLIGNDPFRTVAVESSDGSMFVLQCDNENEEADLIRHQGKSVRVYYNSTSRVPEGKAVHVVRFEWL